MKELTLKQKKEYAKTLFIQGHLTQKDIAAKVNVSEKTLSKWVNDSKENWQKLRVSIILTKEQALRRIYEQISELNDAINQREEGSRYANSKEADTLTKLAAAAKSLETETGVAEIINVFKLFNDFVKGFDLAKAQELIKLEDAFITTRLK